MTDELSIELIRLRHRLRMMATAAAASAHDEASQVLERFRRVSEHLGEEDLLFEHARWRVQLEQLGL